MDLNSTMTLLANIQTPPHMIRLLEKQKHKPSAQIGESRQLMGHDRVLLGTINQEQAQSAENILEARYRGRIRLTSIFLALISLAMLFLTILVIELIMPGFRDNLGNGGWAVLVTPAILTFFEGGILIIILARTFNHFQTLVSWKAGLVNLVVNSIIVLVVINIFAPGILENGGVVLLALTAFLAFLQGPLLLQATAQINISNTPDEEKDEDDMRRAQRRKRILMVVVGSIIAGIVIASLFAVVLLIIAPDILFNDGLVLAGLIVVAASIIAPFSPQMPIWTVLVPDNAVWVLYDHQDRFERFLKPGTYRFRPDQSWKPYNKQGPVMVNIDSSADEVYFSGDFQPFRVRVRVTCGHDALHDNLDTKAKQLTVLDMSKDTIQGIIQAEIEDIVRERLAHYRREGIVVDDLLSRTRERMLEDIDDAINRLSRILGLNLWSKYVSLGPTDMVLNARERRAALEGFVLDGPPEIHQLTHGDRRASIHLTENGIEEYKWSSEEDVRTGAGRLYDLVAEIIQGFVGSAIREGEQVQPPPDQNQLPPSQPQPQGLPEPTPDPLENVVDAEEDEEGVFIPRNPVISRKKGKKGD